MNARQYACARLAGVVVGDSIPENAGAPVIGTHDGNFHCDEALACGLLRHTEEFSKSIICRTRNPDVLSGCNVVVDVGGKYDESSYRFDHHQKEFDLTMDTGINRYNTRLSSAGLVYKHFGKKIIAEYAKCSDADATLLFDRVYKGFIEHIDGIDNGVEEFSGSEMTRNYKVSTTLSERVGRLYPRWNQTQSRKLEDDGFASAMELATTEFFEAVDFFAFAWMPARATVATAFTAAADVHPSEKIIILQEGGCPWKEHLMDLEKESNVLGRTLYVMFPDTKGNWRVQCVPEHNSSFTNRKSLPWKGLRDEALTAASGIEGGIFVHAAGFIGGNKTFEGAKAMAIKALEE